MAVVEVNVDNDDFQMIIRLPRASFTLASAEALNKDPPTASVPRRFVSLQDEDGREGMEACQKELKNQRRLSGSCDATRKKCFDDHHYCQVQSRVEN
jgi:hypothetical protein